MPTIRAKEVHDITCIMDIPTWAHSSFPIIARKYTSLCIWNSMPTIAHRKAIPEPSRIFIDIKDIVRILNTELIKAPLINTLVDELHMIHDRIIIWRCNTTKIKEMKKPAASRGTYALDVT
jgi:hypothetical protein